MFLTPKARISETTTILGPLSNPELVSSTAACTGAAPSPARSENGSRTARRRRGGGIRALFSARGRASEQGLLSAAPASGRRSSPLGDVKNVPTDLERSRRKSQLGLLAATGEQENATPVKAAVATAPAAITTSASPSLTPPSDVRSHPVAPQHPGDSSSSELSAYAADADSRARAGDNSSPSPLPPALDDSPALAGAAAAAPAKNAAALQSMFLQAVPQQSHDSPLTPVPALSARGAPVRTSVSSMAPTPNEQAPTAPRLLVQTPRSSAAVTSLRQQLRVSQSVLQPLAVSPQDMPSSGERTPKPDGASMGHRRLGAVTARASPVTWRQGSALPSAHNPRRLSLQVGAHAPPRMSARAPSGPSPPSAATAPRSAVPFDRRASLPASRLAQLEMPRSLNSTPRKGLLARPQTACGVRLGGSVHSTPRTHEPRAVKGRPQTARGHLGLPPFKTGRAPVTLCGVAGGAESAPNTARPGVDGSRGSAADLPAPPLRDPPQRHAGASVLAAFACLHRRPRLLACLFLLHLLGVCSTAAGRERCNLTASVVLQLARPKPRCGYERDTGFVRSSLHGVGIERAFECAASGQQR